MPLKFDINSYGPFLYIQIIIEIANLRGKIPSLILLLHMWVMISASVSMLLWNNDIGISSMPDDL